MNRREFFQSVGLVLASPTLGCLTRTPEATGELLYNGIQLPRSWPPVRHALPEQLPPAPYELAPPAIIPIDVGRQLFVDDFLIEETDLVRRTHAPSYHPRCPILTPSEPWEMRDAYADRTKQSPSPTAMVFSDGVFYDPDERLFKMWYMAGYQQQTCYATSVDGIDWEKPRLDVVPATNIVNRLPRDSNVVWLDRGARKSDERYKMAGHFDDRLHLFTSADGVHWTKRGESGVTGDRTTFFYNPFRRVWVFSIRDDVVGGLGRHRKYWEARDFVTGARWAQGQPVLWAAADKLDHIRPEQNVPVQLYNLDCVAYESLLLGLFTMYRGEREQREKPNDVCVGFSRDGFHWTRPTRDAFLPVSEHLGDWNWCNVQSAGGGCLVVGDELYFYVSGRQGIPGTKRPGVCSTGLATMRRDGFSSLDEPLTTHKRLWPFGVVNSVTTRPVTFSGRYLFVNADCREGELRVEVLDRRGWVLAPFSAANCVPIRTNGTRIGVTWNNAPELSQLASSPVRFRFILRRGSLYAFWVSPSPTGESRGYIAAGGPGLRGSIDAVGGSPAA
jgi:hypothetical protein